MKVWRNKKGNLNYWCPACKRYHWVSSSHWIMLGSLDEPTIAPGFTIKGRDNISVCHHLISHGRLYYFEDSTHEMRGQWVEMQELTDPPTVQLSLGFVDDR